MQNYLKQLLFLPIFIQICLTSISLINNPSDSKECLTTCINKISDYPIINYQQVNNKYSVSSFLIYLCSGLLISSFVLFKNKNWQQLQKKHIYHEIIKNNVIMRFFKQLKTDYLFIKLSINYHRFYKKIYSPPLLDYLSSSFTYMKN